MADGLVAQLEGDRYGNAGAGDSGGAGGGEEAAAAGDAGKPGAEVGGARRRGGGWLGERWFQTPLLCKCKQAISNTSPTTQSNSSTPAASRDLMPPPPPVAMHHSPAAAAAAPLRTSKRAHPQTHPADDDAAHDHGDGMDGGAAFNPEGGGMGGAGQGHVFDASQTSRLGAQNKRKKTSFVAAPISQGAIPGGGGAAGGGDSAMTTPNASGTRGRTRLGGMRKR